MTIVTKKCAQNNVLVCVCEKFMLWSLPVYLSIFFCFRQIEKKVFTELDSLCELEYNLLDIHM